MGKQFTLYSFVGSQWAGTAHLALAEKGFTEADYHLEEIDLVAASNFDPKYLEINPNGTVPSLTSPSLDKPLSESTDILRYLDKLKGGRTLVPEDGETKRRVQLILDLVHSSDVDTNVILLQARDAGELNGKKNSPWKQFVTNRQAKLDKERAAHPEHPFYGPKSDENGHLHNLYTTETGPAHESFFTATQERYRTFAEGMAKLEKLLVLPYAAGDAITEADFHVVPWLAHAMEGAGTEPSDKQNFEPLERLVQKSVPGFQVGPSTKKWWENMNATASFQKVYPVLH
ncbi:hypothetical protein B0T10DRAFT_547843 [Thelonectria olida]|uniref:Glutathione S-transferase n=1 Tax=Thelonectria olida TaxID=1576542 RepID=A0A9P8W5B4_9HYPO|nr:hypothetical protein B0T10DRAFT_547843 [Thelonectria olida]